MRGILHRVITRSDRPDSTDVFATVPLLTYLHAALLVFLTITLVVIFTFTPTEKRTAYLLIAFVSAATIALSWYLNVKRKKVISYRLTVAIMFIGPWASILYERITHSGDYIPMIFVIIPIQIAALFISTGPMLIISMVQTVALIVLIITSQGKNAYNWLSLVCYVFVASLLGTITSYVIRSQYRKLLTSKDELLRSEQRLRDLSIHDPLSGLYNRRYMEEFLDRLLNDRHPFAILMMDVDRFKSINDTCGHSQGDFIIQTVSALLTESVRKVDIACRYGGDEFLIILIDCTLEDAQKRAEDIRKKVNAIGCACEEPEAFVITTSIGIAMYPEAGANRESLLRAADTALYQAKETGRDRIVVAPNVNPNL